MSLLSHWFVNIGEGESKREIHTERGERGRGKERERGRERP